MLEIRNVSKVYRSKTGEEVRALDNVSISFPETGMVFILGKSGSGKSTLLNVMGGLDSYDEGEFIIKGKSSNDFVGSDFDAYRNTFIGFIFQEYNVLDDFTVGANIGLALELQGKKATDEAINGILTQVDLLNYAKRKPNELSGGQKQRVAIARALVKDPEIIMADEPTGALDSNTGKQIFDTLKELSKTKLVLIVSHDRDFAERYADRIVELADGKIIEDVTKHEHQAERVSDGVHRINDHILRIESGYKLTAKDLEMINEYLAKNNGDVLLSGDGRVNEELRSAAGISKDGATTVFEGTVPEKDIKAKKYEKDETKFIRSKLPMKNAIKMGSSSLKHKKFRLFMTILLSFISFAMFGLASTVAAYESISAATASVLDSHVRNASMTIGVRHSTLYDDGDEYHYYQEAGLNEEDIKKLNEQTGMNFVPVYTGSPYSHGGGFSMGNQMIAYEQNTVYTGKLSGFVNLSADALSQTGFNVVGRLPQSDSEVAITEFMYRQFKEYGFQNNSVKPAESVAAGELTMDASGDKSIIGKTLSFSTNNMMNGQMVTINLKIVGVIDTGFDYARYQKFLPVDETQQPQQQEEDSLFDMVLMNEIEYEISYGFHALGFVTNGTIERLSASSANHYVPLGTYMSGWNSSLQVVLKRASDTAEKDGNYFATTNQIAVSEDISKLGEITWIDGRTDGTLKANEVLIPYHYKDSVMPQSITLTLTDAQVQQLAAIYGEENWAATDAGDNFWARLCEASLMAYVDEQLQNETVRIAVLNEAQNTEYAGDAKAYWLYRLNDSYSYTPDGVEGTFLDRGQIQNGVYDDVWPFIEALYGIDFPNTFDQNDKTYFTDILQNFLAEDLEYEVNQWGIRQDLMWTLVEQEYESKKADFLAEGNDMIQLFIDSGYTSSVDSFAMWNALETYEKENYMHDFYRNYYINSSYASYYDTLYDPIYTSDDLNAMASSSMLHMSGKTVDQILSEITIELQERNYENDTTSTVSDVTLTIAGFYNSSKESNLFVSDTVYNYYTEWYKKVSAQYTDNGRVEDNAKHDDGIWAFVIAPMPTDDATVTKLMQMHYAEEGLGLDIQYQMRNAVMATLGQFDEIIEVVSQVFLWVGLGLAVFSSFLLMNFISTSISYKKREIGILRAVGARSSDVFKIFFSEAFIIALINFVLAVVASLATVIILNTYMRNQGINITLLSFGPLQVIIMLGISILVAALASFLPVYKIAHKKPVDAIKDR